MNSTTSSIKVICNADIKPGVDRKKVQEKLESTFFLNGGDANDFLNGKKTFCRSVENKLIAQKYKQAFNKIGLACVIEIDTATQKNEAKASTPLNNEVDNKANNKPAKDSVLSKKKTTPQNGKSKLLPFERKSSTIKSKEDKPADDKSIIDKSAKKSSTKPDDELTKKPDDKPTIDKSAKKSSAKPADDELKNKRDNKPTIDKSAKKPSAKPADVELTNKRDNKSTIDKSAKKSSTKPADVELTNKRDNKPAIDKSAKKSSAKPAENKSINKIRKKSVDDKAINKPDETLVDDELIDDDLVDEFDEALVDDESISDEYDNALIDDTFDGEYDAPFEMPNATFDSSEEYDQAGSPSLEEVTDEEPLNENNEIPEAQILEDITAPANKKSMKESFQSLVSSLTSRKNEARIAISSAYISLIFYAISIVPANVLSQYTSYKEISEYLPLDGLLSLFFLNPSDFKISYIPMFIGTIFVTISCAFLARLKAYSFYYAGLGLAGPIGLGITLVLPDKFHVAPFKILSRAHVTGYLLICIGGLWLVTPMPNQGNPDMFLQQAKTLVKGRSIYPSKSIDDVQTLLVVEKDELTNYLNAGMELIKNIGNDEEKVTKVSRTMLTEVTNLFQWVNYQRFLAHQAGKPLHTGKGEDPINLLIKGTVDDITTAATRLGNVYLSKQVALWFKPGEQTISSDAQALYTELVNLKLQLSKSGIKFDEKFNIKNFELPEFMSAQVEAGENILKLRPLSSDPNLMDKEIVIAYYSRGYESLGVTRYDIIMKHIGGSIPNYLLPGQLNYFSNLQNQ